MAQAKSTSSPKASKQKSLIGVNITNQHKLTPALEIEPKGWRPMWGRRVDLEVAPNEWAAAPSLQRLPKGETAWIPAGGSRPRGQVGSWTTRAAAGIMIVPGRRTATPYTYLMSGPVTQEVAYRVKAAIWEANAYSRDWIKGIRARTDVIVEWYVGQDLSRLWLLEPSGEIKTFVKVAGFHRLLETEPKKLGSVEYWTDIPKTAMLGSLSLPNSPKLDMPFFDARIQLNEVFALRSGYLRWMYGGYVYMLAASNAGGELVCGEEKDKLPAGVVMLRRELQK